MHGSLPMAIICKCQGSAFESFTYYIGFCLFMTGRFKMLFEVRAEPLLGHVVRKKSTLHFHFTLEHPVGVISRPAELLIRESGGKLFGSRLLSP